MLIPPIKKFPFALALCLILVSLSILGCSSDRDLERIQEEAAAREETNANEEVESTEDKVLVFSKTAGFRHGSIAKGLEILTALATDNNFQIESTEDASNFNIANLSQYKTVLFLNTTGDVLNETQQTEFENYIRAGGSFMGIHAATDTEYDWPWYGELVGAYFDSHPEIQEADIAITNKTHQSTEHFGNQDWTRTDEWYNFKDFNSSINVLLNLDESSYNGGTNGANHPIAWFHEFEGGRSFYTAGGHTDASYDEPDFQKHLLGGIFYCLERE